MSVELVLVDLHSSLVASRHPEIKKVVIPGMCTGCGKMFARVAIRQMMDAIILWDDGSDTVFTKKDIEKEQPLYYENTEFKKISPEHVVKCKEL